MSYPCTGCGLCCRSVGATVARAKQAVEQGNTDPLIKEAADFPFPMKEDGSCSQLLPSGLCAVYEDRPNICSVEYVHATYNSDISQKTYFRSTRQICNNLIRKNHLDKKYIVPKI